MQTNLLCPLCPREADGDLRDIGRAMYFKCEGGHEFVMRTSETEKVAAMPASSREQLASKALARSDGLIALIENNAGSPQLVLVPRSNWLK